MSKSRRILQAIRGRVATVAIALAVASFDAVAIDRMYTSGFEQTAPVAMPLISRSKPAFASGGNAASNVDGQYYGGATWDVTPSVATPAWVAIQVGSGASRAMLSWVAYPGSNIPTGYRIETSADSTNGANGTWAIALTVTGNSVPSRAHSFAFAGKQWVRFLVTQAQNTGMGISMNEIDVHDASAGTSDTWMFVGDSITAAAFCRSLFTDNFPERIRAVVPAHFPLMIGAGEGGTSTNDGVAYIDEWLAIHREIQNWVISYGTNDSANADPQFAPAFGQRLRTIVATLKGAGKTVFVPRIPYKTGGEAYLAPYNAQIDAVRSEFALHAAPDLYAWFIAHPNELYDGVHPNDAGSRSMNRLWAESVRDLYP